MGYDSTIKLKDRYNYTLDTFKGIDLSHDDGHISPSRASAAENFIGIGKIMHKRNGYRELATLDGKINGIFNYRQNGKDVIVIHCGNKFYISQIKDKYITKPEELNYGVNIDRSRICDSKSMAFYVKDKLYIVGCGDYLVYGKFSDSFDYELRRVYNNSDTYIPITTTNIENSSVTTENVSFFENVNMLSPYVRNLLIGCPETNKKWKLDSDRIANGSKVRINMSLLEGSEGYETIKEYTAESGSYFKDRLYYTRKNGTAIDYPEYDSNSCGTVDRNKGEISFSVPTTPPGHSPNIEVIYCPDFEDTSERITQTNIAVMYGPGGKPDRLFVSGNPLYPNIDFYSEYSDPTYFPDVNATAFGNDSSSVVCYLPLSDGTLAILKNRANEACVFYRTGEESYSQDEKTTTTVFSVKAGNTGESALSQHCALNFCGDNVFLSENGIFGLERSGNIYTDTRYAKERSCTIRNVFRNNKKLTDAVATVHNGSLYLSIGDDCYVAPSDSKFIPEESPNGSFSYEWWHFTNISARVWGKIGSMLAFGTEKGKICIFDDDFTDKTLYEITEGDITPNVDKGYFVYNQRFPLRENDTVRLDDCSIYAEVVNVYVQPDSNPNQDGSVSMNPESDVDGSNIFHYVDIAGMNVSDGMSFSCIWEGKEVYVGSGMVSIGGLSPDTPYYISDIDRGRSVFKLKNKDGSYVDSIPEGVYPSRYFPLIIPLCGKDMYLTKVTGNSFMIKESINGNPLNLCGAYFPSDILTGIFCQYDPVKSCWVTPVTDLGSNEKSKTLLKMTLYAESNSTGRIKFGYETRKNNRTSFASKGISSIDLDDISFNDLTFETGFSSSFSVNVNERNFNFIRFRLSSEDEYDCTVNSLTVKYKINKNNTGIN